MELVTPEQTVAVTQASSSDGDCLVVTPEQKAVAVTWARLILAFSALTAYVARMRDVISAQTAQKISMKLTIRPHFKHRKENFILVHVSFSQPSALW
jgi:hypothetical protein